MKEEEEEEEQPENHNGGGRVTKEKVIIETNTKEITTEKHADMEAEKRQRKR